MRVGFITQLLWPRYGDVWARLVEGVGAEVQFAHAERTRHLLEDERLAPVPGLAFRLAAAQALALADTDLILAPALNPGADIARGGGQDPWVASFPEALSTSVVGLPPVTPVAATLDDHLETPAVELLLSLSRDPALVRRVWGRQRSRARPPRYPSLRWVLEPSEREGVGLIGQPWYFSEALLQDLAADGVHMLAQHRLDPLTLREEAWRAEPRLVATDAEVLGAARLFDRRGTVKRLRFIADRDSGVDAWLLEQVARTVRKPLSPLYLQDLDDPVSLLMAS